MGKIQKIEIDVNVGFDSSVQANKSTIDKVWQQIDTFKDDIEYCCNTYSMACDTEVRTHFDWDNNNKPAPASSGVYHPSDQNGINGDPQLSQNIKNISGDPVGVNLLVTNALVPNLRGYDIDPDGLNGPVPPDGVVINVGQVAPDTTSHEIGHYVGMPHEPSDDPNNRMTRGAKRDIFSSSTLPDQTTCQAYQSLAH
ncbi:MAG: hypothetical protein R3F23_07880 [Verrucomicrobiia bacterium]